MKIGSVADYRYPSKRNEWEQLVYDFKLEQAQEAELSLGYASSASKGAADNTLLYIDNIRLGVKVASGIDRPVMDAKGNSRTKVYDLNGVEVGKPSHGVYIVNGKKTML